MDRSQIVFRMTIIDGYTFRNTIGLIKNEVDHASMVLSKNEVRISFVNRSKCALHDIFLKTQEFQDYEFNYKDNNTGADIDELYVGFETSEMFNTTKGIARKDNIRIYLLQGDDKINIQPMKLTNKSHGSASALFVKTLNLERVKFELPSGYNSEPNVRVNSKDFADICSQANNLKCSNLEITGDKTSVIFRGYGLNKIPALFNQFSTRPTDSSKNYDSDNSFKPSPIINIKKDKDCTFNVPIATVKALSKIHNISPQGTLLRFYFADNKPIKIESTIGTYGTYLIYLRPPPTQ